MQTRRLHHRRGITLMFVLSMIVLFLLLATTFVIVSSDFFRASKKRSIKNVHEIDGTAYVQRAFYDLARGPDLSNTTSPLRGQDLLSDMYGYGFKGIVTGVPVVADIPATKDWASPVSSNQQLIEIELDVNVTSMRTAAATVLSDDPGAYNSQILTFISGRAAGMSARIVDYQIDYSGATLARKFIVLIPGRSDRGTINFADLEDAVVIVNGRAFAGIGTGGATYPLNETIPVLGVSALEPNRIGIDRATLTGVGGYLAENAGTNESYDATDYENNFLSGRDSSGDVIASFHRKSLESYHGNADAGGSSNRHMFSAFDGADLVVDADNDGEEDSLWIDPGYPAQSNDRGVRYKALVAYHVVDLDSRLNINLVGNRSEMLNGSDDYAGDGYGPAEISLFDPVAGVGFLTALEYQHLIQGMNGAFGDLPGRYGLGADGVVDTGDEYPGAPGRDEWSIKKLFGYPGGTNTVGKFFQSLPIDIRGRFATRTPALPQVIDLNDSGFNNGLPSMDLSLSVALDDTFTNSPYEANFAPSPYSRWEPGDDDTPFSALELEGLIRPSDADSNLLASRLKEILSTVAGNDVKRSSVTTDSYEVPMSPGRTVDDSGVPKPLLAILRGKITGMTTEAEEEYILEIMSSELLSGMKMDVNRVFGNGFDDSSPANGVIDDPLEPVAQTNTDQAGAPDMDLDNDFRPGVNDELARYKFAKQLYVLMLLVCEEEVALTSPLISPPLTGPESLEAYRTAVAQWAINVVDFRDPDSIHTPFEFDINPWNGWEPDGIINVGEIDMGDRRLVWGAERPELLFSETYAHHDRATQDLDTDDGSSSYVTMRPMNPGTDLDFDSQLIPRTSTFIELYHPWTQNVQDPTYALQQRLPAELARNTANPAGVDLQRRSPGDDPVWRIGVKRLEDDTDFYRTIYFTDLDATPTTFVDPAEQFYTTHTIPVIPPGVFAVVGSLGTSTTNGGNGYRTTFGRIIGATNGTAASLLLDDTRSITLVPTMDPMDNQIVRNEWNALDARMELTGYRGIAVVMDGPRSLSLSDPDGGYPIDGTIDPADDGSDVGDGYGYTLAHDEPLDDDPSRDPIDYAAIWNNGTTDAFRTLYLQRLANPLLDFNVDTNPYITIDVTPVDLLAFNGAESDPTNDNPNSQETSTGGATNGDTDASSLERGENQPGSPLMLFAWDGGINPSVDDLTLVVADSHNFSYPFQETFGRTNTDYIAAGGGGDYYSWLTWNNRPYVSQLELANVPFVSSEYLTRAFSLRAGMDPYVDPAASAFLADNPSLVLGSWFGHLLNFYGHDSNNTSTKGNFYRLFDFTEVPSRYVGTEFWPNPDTFVNNPVNFYSHYRYPGKININTVQEETYNALMGSYASQLGFTSFDDSRWGMVSGADFSRPFRNSGEGNLVPIAGLVEDNVDCGLYRRDGDRRAGGDPIFDFDSGFQDTDPDRSAYFRNAMRQRMGNLVTTRSSVFAIWITVGYFEINEDGSLKGIDSGGVEVGAETGEVVRNRGFYIFDRSIPVAFEPGVNHNVERAIIVQSIIE